MTIEKFKKQIQKEIENTSSLDIDSTGDFQSDITHGFPTILNVNWNTGKAWLSLNESMIDGNMDVEEYEQACADWGIHNCDSIEEFNSLLESLGRDASAYVLPSEESIEQSM